MHFHDPLLDTKCVQQRIVCVVYVCTCVCYQALSRLAGTLDSRLTEADIRDIVKVLGDVRVCLNVPSLFAV